MGLDAFMDELLVARAERRRLEQQRELMAHELEHRVKNLLAMVMAVARQTFAGAVARETLDKYTARLKAISSANGLLIADKWQGAQLREIVETAIAPFRDEGADQFLISGPNVSCSSSASVSLGMALHELCTNAAKYGALSCAGGTVSLTWTASMDGDQFEMEWREAGGPPVPPSPTAGFGTTVISRILATHLNGEVDLQYRPEGLVCTFRCGVSNLMPQSAAA
jgi:two-component sensor histidine kinase